MWSSPLVFTSPCPPAPLSYSSGGLYAKRHDWKVKWLALYVQPSSVGPWVHRRSCTFMVFRRSDSYLLGNVEINARP